MKKYTYLLVVALAIAGVPKSVSAQTGLSIVASEAVSGTYVKTLSLPDQIVSVQHEHIQSHSDFLGNLKFITMDPNLHNKTVVDCKVTIGQLMDFIKVSNGFLVLSITRHSEDSFSKSSDLAPQVTVLDDNGNVISQKEYKEFGFHYVVGQKYRAGLQLGCLLTETKDYFTVFFQGVIFCLNKKDTKVQKSIDTRVSFTPIKFNAIAESNKVFVVTRMDSLRNHSYQYDFSVIDLGNTQGIGNENVVWHQVLPITVNDTNAACYSENLLIEYMSGDSVSLLRYGNQVARDSVYWITVTPNGITQSDRTYIPYLKNVLPYTFEIIQSKYGYYIVSARFYQNYQQANLWCTYNFKDTLFLLNEPLGEEMYEARIQEISSDASILITGVSNNGENYVALRKVARAPFKPNLTVVWNGTLEWSNPLPTGGAVADAFIVAYKTADDADWNTIDLGKVNNYTLKNLNSNTLYSIKVKARNIAGWGEYSDVQTLQTQNTATHNVAVQTLTVYPNPIKAGGVITINAPIGSKCNIFSYDGKMVFSGELSSDQIRLPDLSTGIYVISVYTDNKKYQSKLYIRD